MKRICTLLLIAAFASVFSPSFAQEKSSHYKAAEEMLLNMKADKYADNAVNAIMQSQMKANPILEQNKENISAFVKKYMSWEAIREDLINIYTAEFTESELKDISAFFLTPSGKKLAEKQTDLMSRMMQVGQQKMQSHMGEIMNMMQKNSKPSI